MQIRSLFVVIAIIVGAYCNLQFRKISLALCEKIGARNVYAATDQRGLAVSPKAPTGEEVKGEQWVLTNSKHETTPQIVKKNILADKKIGNSSINEAIDVVESYLTANDWESRLNYVIDPDTVRLKMSKTYGNNWKKIDKYKLVTQKTTKRQDAGKSAIVKVLIENDELQSEYYLKQTEDGFKIDWVNSTGYNEVSLAALKVIKPVEPTYLRVYVKLADYFNYEYKREYSICFEVYEYNNGSSGYGYVHRNSELGELIFNSARDGRWHQMALEVQYLHNSESSNQFKIVGVAALDSWNPDNKLDSPRYKAPISEPNYTLFYSVFNVNELNKLSESIDSKKCTDITFCKIDGFVLTGTDLNNDGNYEYIVTPANSCGSGGCDEALIMKIDSKWAVLAENFGKIIIEKTITNGYNDLKLIADADQEYYFRWDGKRYKQK